MRFPFSSKNKDDSVAVNPPPQIHKCDHKYKDFPWYYRALYDVSSCEGDMKVFEPYVCVKCKQRIDEELFHIHQHTSQIKFKEYIDKFVEEYSDKLLPEVEVNDMIADYRLVDRDYLRILDAIRGGEFKFPDITSSKKL